MFSHIPDQLPGAVVSLAEKVLNSDYQILVDIIKDFKRKIEIQALIQENQKKMPAGAFCPANSDEVSDDLKIVLKNIQGILDKSLLFFAEKRPLREVIDELELFLVEAFLPASLRDNCSMLIRSDKWKDLKKAEATAEANAAKEITRYKAAQEEATKSKSKKKKPVPEPKPKQRTVLSDIDAALKKNNRKTFISCADGLVVYDPNPYRLGYLSDLSSEEKDENVEKWCIYISDDGKQYKVRDVEGNVQEGELKLDLDKFYKLDVEHDLATVFRSSVFRAEVIKVALEHGYPEDEYPLFCSMATLPKGFTPQHLSREKIYVSGNLCMFLDKEGTIQTLNLNMDLSKFLSPRYKLERIFNQPEFKAAVVSATAVAGHTNSNAVRYVEFFEENERNDEKELEQLEKAKDKVIAKARAEGRAQLIGKDAEIYNQWREKKREFNNFEKLNLVFRQDALKKGKYGATKPMWGGPVINNPKLEDLTANQHRLMACHAPQLCDTFGLDSLDALDALRVLLLNRDDYHTLSYQQDGELVISLYRHIEALVNKVKAFACSNLKQRNLVRAALNRALKNVKTKAELEADAGQVESADQIVPEQDAQDDMMEAELANLEEEKDGGPLVLDETIDPESLGRVGLHIQEPIKEALDHYGKLRMLEEAARTRYIDTHQDKPNTAAVPVLDESKVAELKVEDSRTEQMKVGTATNRSSKLARLLGDDNVPAAPISASSEKRREEKDDDSDEENRIFKRYAPMTADEREIMAGLVNAYISDTAPQPVQADLSSSVASASPAQSSGPVAAPVLAPIEHKEPEVVIPVSDAPVVAQDQVSAPVSSDEEKDPVNHVLKMLNPDQRLSSTPQSASVSALDVIAEGDESSDETPDVVMESKSSASVRTSGSEPVLEMNLDVAGSGTPTPTPSAEEDSGLVLEMKLDDFLADPDKLSPASSSSDESAPTVVPVTKKSFFNRVTDVIRLKSATAGVPKKGPSKEEQQNAAFQLAMASHWENYRGILKSLEDQAEQFEQKMASVSSNDSAANRLREWKRICDEKKSHANLAALKKIQSKIHSYLHVSIYDLIHVHTEKYERKIEALAELYRKQETKVTNLIRVFEGEINALSHTRDELDREIAAQLQSIKRGIANLSPEEAIDCDAEFPSPESKLQEYLRLQALLDQGGQRSDRGSELEKLKSELGVIEVSLNLSQEVLSSAGQEEKEKSEASTQKMSGECAQLKAEILAFLLVEKSAIEEDKAVLKKAIEKGKLVEFEDMSKRVLEGLQKGLSYYLQFDYSAFMDLNQDLIERESKFEALIKDVKKEVLPRLAELSLFISQMTRLEKQLDSAVIRTELQKLRVEYKKVQDLNTQVEFRFSEVKKVHELQKKQEAAQEEHKARLAEQQERLTKRTKRVMTVVEKNLDGYLEARSRAYNWRDAIASCFNAIVNWMSGGQAGKTNKRKRTDYIDSLKVLLGQAEHEKNLTKLNAKLDEGIETFKPRWRNAKGHSLRFFLQKAKQDVLVLDKEMRLTRKQ